MLLFLCCVVVSRYFNATAQRVQTLSLGGRAPIAVSFIAPSNDSAAAPSRRGEGAATRAAAATAANGAEEGGSALRVNLQACNSTDRSASDGVLHILSFVDDNVIGVGDGGGGGGGGGVGSVGGGSDGAEDSDGDGRSVGDGIYLGSERFDGDNGGATDGNNGGDGDSAANGVGDGGVGAGVGKNEVGGRVGDGVGDGVGGGVSGGIDGVDGAGVLVPDVLELTYAFGFRKTYEAIIFAANGAEAAEKTSGVTSGSAATVPGDALGDVSATALAAAGTRTAAGVGEGAGAGAETEGGEDAPPVSASRGDAPKMTVADALRGAEAHTLLAVADSDTEQAASRTISLGSSEGSGSSAATLR